MEAKEIERMWNIDSKLQLNDKITDEEKKFYNIHLEEMREEMRSNHEHWKYHTNPLKLDQ